VQLTIQYYYKSVNNDKTGDSSLLYSVIWTQVLFSTRHAHDDITRTIQMYILWNNYFRNQIKTSSTVMRQRCNNTT